MAEGIQIKRLKSAKASPVSAKEATPGQEGTFSRYLNAEISFSQGLSDKIKEAFYIELASMLKAGIDLRTALDIIIEAHTKKKAKTVFQSIIDKVINGATLSSALKATSQFTDYEYYTLQIGEETGKLVEVLEELSLFFQKKIKQRRLIIGALAYPATIVVVAVGAIVFMLSYVVPMFSDIFKRSGDDLPAITKGVIAISQSCKEYGSLFLYTVAGLLAIGYWQRKEIWMRKLTAKLILGIPVWGKLAHKIYLAQFSQTIAMLLGANVSILKAMQLTKLIVRLYPFQAVLEQVEKDVIIGTPLHLALKKHSLFPLKLVAMIKVGEETNQLSYFFKQIAAQLANEVEHQSTLLSKFIEPAIIILLGLLVGVILIAMYLPLFQMGQQF